MKITYNNERYIVPECKEFAVEVLNVIASSGNSVSSLISEEDDFICYD